MKTIEERYQEGIAKKIREARIQQWTDFGKLLIWGALAVFFMTVLVWFFLGPGLASYLDYMF